MKDRPARVVYLGYMGAAAWKAIKSAATLATIIWIGVSQIQEPKPIYILFLVCALLFGLHVAFRETYIYFGDRDETRREFIKRLRAELFKELKIIGTKRFTVMRGTFRTWRYKNKAPKEPEDSSAGKET